MNKISTPPYARPEKSEKLSEMDQLADNFGKRSTDVSTGQPENTGEENLRESNFIRKALADIRPALLNNGFVDLKLKNILVCIGFSKTKFFNYFGSVNGFYEILLHHEFSKCYSTIPRQVLPLPDYSTLKEGIILYRNRNIQQNEILALYFSQCALFTSKFEGLIKAVVKIETDILTDYIAELTGNNSSRSKNRLIAKQILTIPLKYRNE